MSQGEREPAASGETQRSENARPNTDPIKPAVSGSGRHLTTIALIVFLVLFVLIMLNVVF